MNEVFFSKKNIFLLIFMSFLVIIFIFLYLEKKKDKFTNIIIEKNTLSGNIKPINLDIIQAKSYIAYDILENKIIFSKNEHQKLPLASVTKLMTGLVVLDVLPSTTVVQISMDDIKQEGDSGLLFGEKWKLKDLLDFSLISSSNDGMHALASALSDYEAINSKTAIDIMNEKAKLYGMNDTFFINETGLDINMSISGAYSSPYDIASLLGMILKDRPSLVLETTKQIESFVSESNFKHVAVNTDILVNKIPSLIASKTGFTDLAGGNLAVVFDAGFMHPVAVVVLGSTSDGRFSDVDLLVQASLRKLSENN